MRPIFDEEVAQFLGYQKYRPEKKDWALAGLVVIAVMIVFVGIIVGVLMLTGNWDRQFKPTPCSAYTNTTISNTPIRCLKELGIAPLTDKN